jgi:hypothetical protein|eukprot:jgi/Chrpa1/2192/Chrysochromulina_OHIO_Genome00010064-RA
MKLQSIRGCIVAALSVGVPLYNRGDPQGCFEAYAKAASECLAYSSAPALKESTSRIQATLSRALDLTSAQSSAEERAWTMRRALDTVLEEIAATESPRPTSSANQPQVQPWPLDFTRQDAADAWMAVDDRIMGGSSRSRVVFENGVSVFEGVLIEQGGGFATDDLPCMQVLTTARSALEEVDLPLMTCLACKCSPQRVRLSRRWICQRALRTAREHPGRGGPAAEGEE